DAERLGDFSAGSTFGGALGTQTVADVLNGRNWTGTPCTAAISNLGGAAPAVGTNWSSIFPTNVVPLDCQDPVSVALLQQYVPHANTTDATNTLNLFQAVPNGNNFANQFTLRWDHRINDNQQFNA